jgi:tRNA(Ile2) C34 agmatinyltransferase TiaS
MFERNELVCAVCGHTRFIVHRGQLHCSKCGAAMSDVMTTSACLHQLENGFEPRSRR